MPKRQTYDYYNLILRFQSPFLAKKSSVNKLLCKLLTAINFTSISDHLFLKIKLEYSTKVINFISSNNTESEESLYIKKHRNANT